MKKIKALGIKSPNASILAENIIKNGAEEGILMTISAGAENGMEDLARKYGLKYELQRSGKEVEIRMALKEIQELDVSGETCPGPIIIVGDHLNCMDTGERVKIKSKKAETIEDLAVSLEDMGGKVVDQGIDHDKIYIVVEKVEKSVSADQTIVKRDKVLVVQSNGIGNAEKAYATFIFAKAALSMGKEVGVFLLMDGVSIAPKGVAATVKHPAFERLDKLMKEAIASGAKIYVCELSAEFRGIKQENLAEGCQLAGAATYVTLLSDPSYAVVNF